MLDDKTTISVIKADIGGWPGHASVHPELIKLAETKISETKSEGIIHDFCVTNCGDDLELIMAHFKGFEEGTEKANELKLYGAGQDMLSDAFSGNVRGIRSGIAEMEFTERTGEPLVVFMMDKTEPGAFNLPIYRMFADPFNTAGLIIDPTLHEGFRFEVWDIHEHKKVLMNTPEEMYDLLALIGAKERYVIKRVFPKEEHPKLGGDKKDEPVALISTEKLFQIAGEYVGKDDPVGIVCAQSGLPALGEVLEPINFLHLVSGWMRGAHNGPLMPVPHKYARCIRFDGSPRVTAFGSQVANGTPVAPIDLFENSALDYTRKKEQYVFIVHGHNYGLKETVARYIEHIGGRVIVLHEQPNEGKTVIEKFEKYSKVGYAVALMSRDDRGGLFKDTYENQRPRARQNVIFEIGYFTAKLGRGQVCVLYEENVEIPSDLGGINYIKLDSEGAWKTYLARELMSAGIDLDLNKMI